MRIIVLFNLRDGVEAADYEAWAQSADIPGVRALQSVADFQVYRATGLIGRSDPPPYAYIEVIDVADPEGFQSDVGGEAVQRLAAEFQALADDPLFVTLESL